MHPHLERLKRGKALRTFHTEFPEPLIHEIACGFNTENTEEDAEGRPAVALSSLSVLLCVLRTTRSELRREARRFFRLPLATSHLPLPASLVAALPRWVKLSSSMTERERLNSSFCAR